MIGAGGRESRCSVRVCRDRPTATLLSMIPAPSINASITPPKVADRDADFIPARKMSDFVGAYEGSGGVVHRTKLRAEHHRAMARSGEPYMSSDDADVGFLGARAEPHVAASHPELVRSARWWRLVRRPCPTPLDSLCARGCEYRG